MTVLKNIYKLDCILPDEDVLELESGAALIRRHASIVFKIKEVNIETRSLIILVTQEPNLLENNLTSSELVERTIGFFDKSFPGWTLKAHVISHVNRVSEYCN